MNPTTGLPVEALTMCRANSGSSMASTMATTTAKYSGRHPAMTALMASFSATMGRLRRA